MKTLILRAIAGAAIVVTMTGCAQHRMGQGLGGQAMGSGTGTGMGTGTGTGMGMGMGGPGAGGAASTPGWSMMTPEERRAHRAHMQSFTSPQECMRYMEQHHQQMVERAKERGEEPPPAPRYDDSSCQGMRQGAQEPLITPY